MKKYIEYKSFEIKGIDYNEETDELHINGYASVFNVEDALGKSKDPETGKFVIAKDVVENTAFDKTISENGERMAFCLNHDLNNPVAKIVELKSDDLGLFVKARISDSETMLKTKIREKIYKELSFGFFAIRASFERNVNGELIRKIKEAQVWEISIVTIGRNEFTKFVETKSIELIDELINTEKNQDKRFQLLQLKSLFDNAPEEPPIEQPPINSSKSLNLSKFKFI